MTLVRALDREEAPSVQVVVTVTDDVPANIVALPRTIRGEYRPYKLCFKSVPVHLFICHLLSIQSRILSISQNESNCIEE